MNQKNKVYIGIDPGLKGGISFLTVTQNKKLYVMPLPIYRSLDEYEIDAWMLSQIILKNVSIYDDHIRCSIEKTWNVSKGGIAIAKLNYSAGLINGVLRVLNISTTKVAPVTWKKRVIGNYRASKEDTIRWVHKTFPEVNLLRTLKSKKDDDNLADAIAIAYYAMLQDTK